MYISQRKINASDLRWEEELFSSLDFSFLQRVMDVSGSTHNIHAFRFHRVSFSAEISHRGHAGNKHVLIRYCGQLMDGHRCKELIHSDNCTETVI